MIIDELEGRKSEKGHRRRSYQRVHVFLQTLLFRRGRNPVHMDIGILLRFIEKCGADSINLGTGESCLHPEFHGALEEFHRRDIPVALTTAGPSVEAMSDTELSRLHDIDFSLDFPGEDLHDRWRAPGAFKMVMDGISRCRKLGVTASVAMCLMEQNAGFMEAMCRLCDSLGVSLRVNVYKAVSTREYEPEYHTFWRAVDTLFAMSSSAVSSEPVVNAALAEITGGKPFPGEGSPCGTHSLRLRPGGEVLPCVYWDRSGVTMTDFLEGRIELPSGCGLEPPPECVDCPWLHICAGGCSGRRLYTGRNLPDIYCFRTGGRNEPPELTVPRVLQGDAYIHASYLCTMIGEFR